MMSASLERVRSFVLSNPRVILGSSSRSRQLIMDELRSEHNLPPYEVITAGIDEKAIRHEEPENLVMALGRGERQGVLANIIYDFHPDSIT